MSGDTPAVSVCIVAYQAREFIERCIASVIGHTHACPIEILLIDNGTDGTGEYVGQRFPEVRVLPSEGNIGFGAGCNRLAAAARAELLLFLNPDTWLTDPAIDRLWDFTREKPGAAAWGGWTVLPGGEPDYGNFITFPTIGRLFASVVVREALASVRRAEWPKARRAPRKVDVLCGGFMSIRADVFAALGGFDESFFLYAEETDLFARLKATGGEAWITPDACIVHNIGSGQEFSPSRAVFQFKGAMHYVRKHNPATMAWLGAVALWFLALRQTVNAALCSGRSARHRNQLRASFPLVVRPWRWWAGYGPGGQARRMR